MESAHLSGHESLASLQREDSDQSFAIQENKRAFRKISQQLDTGTPVFNS